MQKRMYLRDNFNQWQMDLTKNIRIQIKGENMSKAKRKKSPKRHLKKEISKRKKNKKSNRKKNNNVRSIYDFVPPLESYSVPRDMYKEALEAHEKEVNMKDQSVQTSQEELESIIDATNEDLSPVANSFTEPTSCDTANSSTQT